MHIGSTRYHPRTHFALRNMQSRQSMTAPFHVVTGAFGYSGKYIARRLLEQGRTVHTLTNSPDRANPFEGKVLNEALTNASLLFEKAIIESGQEPDSQDAGEQMESSTVDHQHP